jgi:hypothetical protein
MPNPRHNARRIKAAQNETGIIGRHDKTDQQRREILDTGAHPQKRGLQPHTQVQTARPQQQGGNAEKCRA